ncbi:hypothetical protein G8759_19825 [Spirosoma aureum]|uniref:Site-specific integrase n=1 Tax=Spirosoma aureum TaxID=2692134 RepID=A0A6G9AQL7_9BACT|nr:phage integrase SAM-like domain-containing protein [Spirosoma aureum]QIP14700.1 hypothetical protein G8759_19825 [Spirosoma aureum]
MFYQNRMQVLFKLRRNYRPSKRGKPKPAEVALYARITVNTYTADISTNVKVNPRHWNQAKQKVTDAAPTADLDNQLLERMKVKLKKAFNLLDQDDVHVTAQQVLEVYRGQKRVRYTIQTMLERLLKQHEERISDDPDELATSKDVISGDTYEAYQKYTNNILDYLVDSKQTRAYIDEIDEAWLNEFKAWGQRKFAINYLGKHLYYIKSLLDYAVLKKAVRSNSIKPYKVEKDEPDPDDMVFLYPDELALLQTFNFHSLSIKPERAVRLERLRDAYIFMQQIGTHHAEYKQFVAAPSSYLRVVSGVSFIRMKRKKTKKYLIAPLKPINFSLAEKYGGFDKLPTCSLTQFNDGLTLISAYLGFHKTLTTKSARKTFADHNLNEHATDVHTTARMMGLSSIEYLKHYAHIDERRMIREMNLQPDPVSES